MEKKILLYNDIYKNAMESAELTKCLLQKLNIESKMGFYNNHEIKIGKTFIKEIYPIPVLSCEKNNIKIDIGFDIATNYEYIGFIELTLNKKDLISFPFYKFQYLSFEVYGYENCLVDYYNGNIPDMLNKIRYSEECKFHIGFNLADIQTISVILQSI